MSSIDERVVQMEFENAQFEKNAKKSIKTLDELKKNLDLSKAVKSFNELDKASRAVSLDSIGNSLSNIESKFSALGIMGVTTLRNISQEVFNTGKQIAEMFTIAPVKSGLEEYETQINAVQTILANTQSKGITLDQVNAALDELNHYADMTIYNFTEMTRNIGTFTAAGVDLDTSVAAIKGIANLAAVSGSTSQQASTAMYQLSQALATGTVKLQDWNSVVNAGMGGQVFQEALKDTARVHGIAIDQMIEEEGSFRETLTKGWLSSEVLTETLSKFTGDLTQAQIESMGYTADQAKEIVKLGQTANDAATKVKTFTQLMDTLKEAAQSGWTESWETIIGDFEQAKELWTGVSDVLGDMIQKSADSRNTLLKGALTNKWDKLTQKIEDAGVSVDSFNESAKEILNANGYNADALIEKYGSLEKVFRAGVVPAKLLKEAINGIGNSKSNLSGITELLKFGSSGEDVKKVQQALKDLGYSFEQFGIDGIIGSETDAAIRAFQEFKGLDVDGIVGPKTLEALSGMGESAKSAVEGIDDLVDGITELGGRELLIDSAKNAFSALMKVVTQVKNAFRSIFPKITADQLYGWIEQIHKFSESLEMSGSTANKIRNSFKGLFALLDIIRMLAGGTLSIAFEGLKAVLGAFNLDILDVTNSVGKALIAFRNWIKTNSVFEKGVQKAAEWIKNGISLLKTWYDEFKSIPEVQEFALKFQNGFQELISNFPSGIDKAASSFVSGAKVLVSALKRWYSEFMQLPQVQDFMTKMESVFGPVIEYVSRWVNIGREKISEIIEVFKHLDKLSLDDVIGYFRSIKDSIINWFTELISQITNFKNNLSGAATGAGNSIMEFLKIFQPLIDFAKKNAGAFIAIGSLIVILKSVHRIVETVSSIAGGLGRLTTGLTGVFDSLSGVLKSVSRYLDTQSEIQKSKAKADFWYTLAKSIALIAGSIALLSRLDTAKMIIGATVLGAFMGGMAILSTTAKKWGGTIPNMAGMAASILILIGALKLLETVKIDAGLIPRFVMLGVLMAAMVIAMKALSNVDGSKFSGKSAVNILALAVSMRILVSAIKALGEVDVAAAYVNIPILAAAIGGMVVIAKAASNLSFSSAAGLLMLPVSLMLLVHAIDMIAGIDVSKITSNLGAFVSVFIMLTLLMAISKKAGANSAKFGIGIVGIAVSLKILISVIDELGSIRSGKLTRGIAAMSLLVAFIGAMAAITNRVNSLSSPIKTGTGLLLMSASIAVLAASVAALSAITPSRLAGATAAIGALILCFAGLSAASQFAKGSIKSIFTMTVCLGLLAGVMIALSFIDPEKLQNAATALSSIMLGFAAVMATSKLSTNLIANTAILVVTLLGITGIFYLMEGLDTDGLLVKAASLSLVLRALSSAMLASSKVPITGALQGVGAIAIFIGGLAGIVAIAGWLSKLEGFNAAITAGGNFLENLGNALGKFAGGILGGIGEATSASLPAIGKNLSDFADSIAPFFTTMSSLDTNVGSTISSVAGSIVAITGAQVLNGVSNLLSFLSGGNSLTDFGEELAAFGTSLTTYAKSVDGLNAESITNASEAMMSIVEFADSIPNEGGAISYLIGDNTLSKFGEELAAFGPQFAAYANAVQGIKDDTLTASTAAAQSIVAFAQDIPTNGGLLGLLMGNNKMSTFGENLATFGTYFSQYATAVQGVTEEDLASSTAAANAIVAFAQDIPTTGGFLSVLMGDNDMQTFGENLVDFADGFVQYYDTIKGVNFEKLSSITGEITDLVALSSTLVGTDLSDLAGIGYSLNQFAQSLVVQYSTVFTDNQQIITAGENMIASLTNGISNKESDVSSSFTSVLDSCVSQINNYYSEFEASGAYIMDGLAQGIASNKSSAIEQASSAAAEALKAANATLGIHSPSKEFEKTGMYSDMGLARGFRSYGRIVTKASSGVANTAMSSVQNVLANLASVVDAGVNSEPLISPVVDLSHVRSGMSQVNSMFGRTQSLGVSANLRAVNANIEKIQNGSSNDDVIAAINSLGKSVSSRGGNTYVIDGITYDDGSNISDAVQTLVRAARMKRRA